MAGNSGGAAGGSPPPILIEFRDELKKGNTYVRTRHNSLRCFPICSPVHKTKSFCGYPLYVSVTVDPTYNSMPASDFTLLGELKPMLKEGRFKMGELYDTSQFKPTSAESASVKYFCARMYREEQVDSGRRLLYIFMPPNKWHCSGKTREKEMHCFSVSLLVGGLVMFKQDSPGFFITRLGRQLSSGGGSGGQDDEGEDDDDGSTSGSSTRSSVTGERRPLKSPRLSDISLVSRASASIGSVGSVASVGSVMPSASASSVPFLVDSSTASSTKSETSSAASSSHSSSFAQLAFNQSRAFGPGGHEIPLHHKRPFHMRNSGLGEGLPLNPMAPPSSAQLASTAMTSASLTTMPLSQSGPMTQMNRLAHTQQQANQNRFEATKLMMSRPSIQVQTQLPPLTYPSSTGVGVGNQPQISPFSQSRLPISYAQMSQGQHQGHPQFYDLQGVAGLGGQNAPSGMTMGVYPRHSSPLMWVDPATGQAQQQASPMQMFNQQILQQQHEQQQRAIAAGSSGLAQQQSANIFMRNQSQQQQLPSNSQPTVSLAINTQGPNIFRPMVPHFASGTMSVSSPGISMGNLQPPRIHVPSNPPSSGLLVPQLSIPPSTTMSAQPTRSSAMSPLPGQSKPSTT